MFDLGAISSVADTLSTGVRDIDSRMETISNQLDLLIVLTIMNMPEGTATAFPADQIMVAQRIARNVSWALRTLDAEQGSGGEDD